MSELKNCPFCGGEAETKMYLWGQHSETKEPIRRYYAFCTNCEAMTDNMFRSKEEAIDAWNSRSDGWIPVSKELPSIKNGYVDQEVLVCSRNKNKEGGIYLPDISCFDGESWSQRAYTWEDIMFWKPIILPEGVD